MFILDNVYLVVRLGGNKLCFYDLKIQKSSEIEEGLSLRFVFLWDFHSVV